MSRIRPVLLFFLLALGFSWAAWIPYAASQAGRLKLPVSAEFIWLAEFGPTLAALVLTVVTAGWAGGRRLLGRLLLWKVGIRWYLFALLLTPILASLALVGDYFWSGATPDLTLLADWHTRFLARTRAFSPSMGLISSLVEFMSQGPLATALIFVLLAVTNGGLSEEVGWRGYALPRLQEAGWSALASSLLVGLMWGLWHTGTGFWQVMLTESLSGAASFAAVYLLQYSLLVIPLAILYTCLYNGTGGSLLLAVLLHAAYNMTVTVVTSAWPEFPMGIFVILLWVVAIAAVIRFKPGTLADAGGDQGTLEPARSREVS